MALADLVVVMNAGRIEQQGRPRDVFNAPRTEFVARFIGGHNVIPASGGSLVAVRADKTQLSRAPLPAGANVVAATVRAVEYQGTHVVVTLVSDEVAELSVMLTEATFAAAPWQPGDSASAHWAANDIHPLAA